MVLNDTTDGVRNGLCGVNGKKFNRGASDTDDVDRTDFMSRSLATLCSSPPRGCLVGGVGRETVSRARLRLPSADPVGTTCGDDGGEGRGESGDDGGDGEWGSDGNVGDGDGESGGNGGDDDDDDTGRGVLCVSKIGLEGARRWKKTLLSFGCAAAVFCSAIDMKTKMMLTTTDGRTDGMMESKE